MGDALLGRANVAFVLSQQAEARRYFAEAAEVYRQSGDRGGLAIAIQNQAAATANLGDPVAARRLDAEALALFRENGNRDGLSIALNNRGDDLRRRGDLDGALSAVNEALAVARDTGNQTNVAFVLCSVGDVLIERGDLVGARRDYEQALANQEARGETLDAAASRMWLGRVAFLDGDFAGSEERLRKAAAGFEAAPHDEQLASCRALLAETLLATRRSDEAARVIEQAGEGLTAKTYEVRLIVGIATARVDAARGKRVPATARLNAALADLKKTPFMRYELGAATRARRSGAPRRETRRRAHAIGPNWRRTPPRTGSCSKRAAPPRCAIARADLFPGRMRVYPPPP